MIAEITEHEQRLRKLVNDALCGAILLAYKPHNSSYNEWVEYIVRWRAKDGHEFGTHVAQLSLALVPDGDYLYWGHYFPLHGADKTLVAALARADYEQRH